jgi:hypothetical protein
MRLSLENYEREIETAAKKIKDLEVVNERTKLMLENEVAEKSKLNFEIDKFRSLVNQESSHGVASKKFEKTIQGELKAQSEKVNAIIAAKQRKANAIFILMFFLKKAIRNFRHKKLTKAAKVIANVILGSNERKKRQQQQDKRAASAKAIQSRFRGHTARQKRVLLDEMAKKMQSSVRRYNAMKYRKQLQLEKTAAIFSSKYRASSIISRAVWSWNLRRIAAFEAARETAATKLQHAVREYLIALQHRRQIQVQFESQFDTFIRKRALRLIKRLIRRR